MAALAPHLSRPPCGGTAPEPAAGKLGLAASGRGRLLACAPCRLATSAQSLAGSREGHHFVSLSTLCPVGSVSAPGLPRPQPFFCSYFPHVSSWLGGSWKPLKVTSLCVEDSLASYVNQPTGSSKKVYMRRLCKRLSRNSRAVGPSSPLLVSADFYASAVFSYLFRGGGGRAPEI